MKIIPALSHMYPWCDYTANPLEGKCPNGCIYCYMKDLRIFPNVRRKYSGVLRISEKDLRKPTGKPRVRRREDLPFVPENAPVIFVCSGSDLGVAPFDAKMKILKDCWNEPQNFYLIQSKVPSGFIEVEEFFPPNVIVGTTVETNRAEVCQRISKTPSPQQRIEFLNELKGHWKMISIEPKIVCDPPVLSKLIHKGNPDFVSIGADRGSRHDLPEPSTEKLKETIDLLEKFTLVYKKENLNRLLLN